MVALLRGAGGLAALAAVPSIDACGTGTSRTSSSGSKGGGTYGEALQNAIHTPSTQETGINVKVSNTEGTQMPPQIKQSPPQFDLITNSMKELVKHADQDGPEKLDRIR
ncbi:hypothetical protein [Streptomyces sp. NPDC050287]|uniref:hypothetical protein n=1 Tax=Streptomyces sp. NPDC050287 TaxID=3365608 RepID=UPI00378C3D6B